MSKVIIFGAGPTGMTLAWLYSRRGFNVTVYEKWKGGGGSWATKWTDDGYFTHHSPQVLATSYVNTFNIWNEMGIDTSRFLTNADTSWIDSLKNISPSDFVKLAIPYLRYASGTLPNITVEKYFEDSDLTREATKSLLDLCYLAEGVPPSVMTMDEIYGVFDQNIFYKTMEMKEATDSPNGYATLMQERLEAEGVKFVWETSLLKLKEGGVAHLERNGNTFNVTAGEDDHMIIAIDPGNLIDVIERSDPNIQNNWGVDLPRFLRDGLYHSLSIQFHFDEPWLPKLASDTNRGSDTQWGIICVQVPNTIAPSSLSSTILNLSHVKGLSPQEIKTEAWRQIKKANPYFPEPFKTTFGEGATYNGATGVWSFDMSAAAITVNGELAATGNIKNLHIVGPLNNRRFKATTMEAAVESAILFSGGSVQHSLTLSSVIIFLLIVIVIFTVVSKIS
jgi:hypothetical protein